MATSPPPLNSTTSQAIADRVRVLQYAGQIAAPPIEPSASAKDKEHKRVKGSHVDFCRAAGVTFGTMDPNGKAYRERLSRWINNPTEEWELLGKENYEKLIAYLLNEHPHFKDQIAAPIKHLLHAPLYHAIAPLLNCEDRLDARRVVVERMVGKYYTYKASARQPHYGYRGIMEISYDEPTNAIATMEFYEKSKAETWNVPGTIYPISHDMFIILSVDLPDSTVKIAFINERGTFDKNDKNAKVPFFTGWLADTDRHKYFTTPIYAKRIPEGGDEKLDFKLIKDFDEDIKRYLSRRLDDENTFVYTPIAESYIRKRDI